ncbi:sensor histidine kinase [Leucobacter massiliensis]|uniref:histidine kinase n=1 Tax=Leucobacter massiliensis TaxID=1686285 RepID=A0A2S9QPK5_9MICO|nr:sensor histidine kinase [Leucobacter massiliensis]PRI11512.1 hypothetical protein B4915_06710 [Leucobacter massiliensis]
MSDEPAPGHGSASPRLEAAAAREGAGAPGLPVVSGETPRGPRAGLSPWVLMLIYLLIAVLLAALGWAGLWSALSLLGERPAAWSTLLTAVPAAAIVLLKRRAPRTGLVLATVLFAADLLTAGGLVPLLVMLEMLHATVVGLDTAGRRRMLGAVVVATVALTALSLAVTRDPRATVVLGLQFGALLGFSYWYANSIAQSQELVRLYRQRAEAAEQAAELDRLAAVQGERDRMARELHDVVAGHISAVAIRSEAALAAAGTGGAVPDAARAGGTAGDGAVPALTAEGAAEAAALSALRAVRDASLAAHGALRSMIGVLRSGERDFAVPPGRARLPQLVAEANASGVRATLNDEIAGELPAPVDQAVGRIVQEALANSVRHSSGARVEVRLGAADRAVRVEVRSRGGAALRHPGLEGSGMGLELLAERARALGGELHAGPEGESEWVVRARLPREEHA